jgi:hypothetical protein
VRAEDMPYVGTWEDEEVEGLVNNWIKQFEI